jgi:hypothetical protein
MRFLDGVASRAQKNGVTPSHSFGGRVDQDSDTGAYRLRGVETKQKIGSRV